MIAVSDNLISWERLGSIVRGEDNKDHVLFPRRINGRYVALHRRPPQVWLAESDDLIHWQEEHMRPIFGPRPDNGWDEKRVGGNGVPIETEHGWLMLYHAYNDDHVYRLGVCLLDLDDPERLPALLVVADDVDQETRSEQHRQLAEVDLGHQHAPVPRQ